MSFKPKNEIVENLEESETGNWNGGKIYSSLIMNHLIKLSTEYEPIAMFGSIDIIEEFMTDNQMRNMARYKAIKRIYFTIDQLIRDSKFAIKKGDKPLFGLARDDLMKVNTIIDQVKEETFNVVTKQKELKINEEVFQNVFSMLMSIKESLLDPMNRAELIFMPKEEYDPKAYKEAVFQRMISP